MKKVFITGASKGIGKAIRILFSQSGYEVVAPTRKELDLANPQSVEKYIEDHKSNSFDVIINNAGYNSISTLENFPDDEVQTILQVNLISPICILKAFTPKMKIHNYGRIVNIGSIWAQVSKQGRSIYSASKNGLHGITNTLALELAEHNILVNTVCPGFVLTELTKNTNTPEQISNIQKEIPLKRLAEPEEIAKLVFFLASDDNSYITGQKILIDGGYTIR